MHLKQEPCRWILRTFSDETTVWLRTQTCLLVCLVQYQLQRSSPWRSVSFQWQTWLVLIIAFVLLGLVPYVVHCMMTAFTNPPPPSTFKVAAVSFGLLTEILLIKWVFHFSLRIYWLVYLYFFRHMWPLVWSSTIRILMINMMIWSDVFSSAKCTQYFQVTFHFYVSFKTRCSERPCHPNNHLWKRVAVRPLIPPHLLFSLSLLSNFDIANWNDACGTVNH